MGDRIVIAIPVATRGTKKMILSLEPALA